MTVIVSDTSPLRALAHLGLLGLLQGLYGQLHVPPAVERELLHPPPALPVVDVRQLSFVSVQAPQQLGPVQHFRPALDPGESEALALAVELQAHSILIDERQGRARAKQLGLTPLGTLGTLVRAKQAGLITAVRPLMDRLENEIKFFISPQLRADVLRRAGEQP